MNESLTLEQRLHAMAEAEKQVLDIDKNALFDAIWADGIGSIVVTFDGYGDSGQIENIAALAGETEVPLPDLRLRIRTEPFHTEEIAYSELSLPEAIETLCYRYLSSKHGNWEDDDGAYGQFQFDAVARTIQLDFNERYTDSRNYTESF